MADEDQTQTQEPTPGSDEYNQMMAEKGKGRRAPNATPYPDTGEETGEATETQGEAQGEGEQPNVPEGVPAKFVKEDGTVDVVALAKSYSELEQRQSQGTQQSQEQGSEGGEGQQSQEQAEATEQAAQAGLDYDTLSKKVAENGDLDDEDYAAFEKAGIPRQAVEEYINLSRDKAQRVQAEMIEYGGGEETVNELMDWAAKNLSGDEIDGYNQMLRSPNWKAALDTLKSQRNAAAPTANEPNLRTPNGTTSGTPTGYTSKDEQKADMADPRYFKAGAEGDKFRAEVARKTRYASWRTG